MVAYRNTNLDRLGTYVPWVSVLLGGLMLAIFQESVARMFAIPFLQKYTKSKIIAVFISSFIWGIAQEGISQPFYIRGLELTITGLMISWVFLRYGIPRYAYMEFQRGFSLFSYDTFKIF